MEQEMLLINLIDVIFINYRVILRDFKGSAAQCYKDFNGTT